MTDRRLSERVTSITESATMAVTNRVRELRESGEPVIGFGAGEPDFPTPEHIVAAAVEACRDPSNHRYSPAAGLPVLREAVAAKIGRDSLWQPDSSQVLITNGGKHAVYNTCAALLSTGEEMLLPAPYWTTYPEAISLAGGVPVVVPTDASTGFRVSVDQLERARTSATKAIMFVSPSNPTGAVYPIEEIVAIGEWAAQHGIWVVADEIYEHLTYENYEHHSIRAVVPALAEHCVVISGVAKTYAMTGWRVGWMVGPDDLIAAASNLQSHATSNVANVAQRASLAAITGGFEAVEVMRAAFDRRRRLMFDMLSEIEGVELLEPQGAFYTFPDLSSFLNRPIGGHTARTTVELATTILDHAKIALVPGEAFGAPGYARLSFALADDQLMEGLTRLGGFLSD